MKNLIFAFYFGRLVRIVFRSLIGKSDLGISEVAFIDGRYINFDVGNTILFGEFENNIFYRVFNVILNVILHALFSCFAINYLLLFFLGLKTLFLSIDHFENLSKSIIINQIVFPKISLKSLMLPPNIIFSFVFKSKHFE